MWDILIFGNLIKFLMIKYALRCRMNLSRNNYVIPPLRITLGSMSGLGRFKTGDQEDAADFLHMLLMRAEQEVGCAGPHPQSGHRQSQGSLLLIFTEI